MRRIEKSTKSTADAAGIFQRRRQRRPRCAGQVVLHARRGGDARSAAVVVVVLKIRLLKLASERTKAGVSLVYSRGMCAFAS